MEKIKKKNYLLQEPGQSGRHLLASLTIILKDAVKDSINAEFALAFALIENHYFVNKGFLDDENQLLDNIDIIRNIPAIIVQGRYDVVCPPTTAYELHSRWPESELTIAPFSGHSSFEKEITHELINLKK